MLHCVMTVTGIAGRNKHKGFCLYLKFQNIEWETQRQTEKLKCEKSWQVNCVQENLLFKMKFVDTLWNSCQIHSFFFFSTLLTKMTYCHNLENNSVRLCTGLKKIDIIKRIYSYNYSVSMDRTFNLHLYYKSPLYIKTSLFITHTFINRKKRHTDICKFPWSWRTI